MALGVADRRDLRPKAKEPEGSLLIDRQLLSDLASRAEMNLRICHLQTLSKSEHSILNMELKGRTLTAICGIKRQFMPGWLFCVKGFAESLISTRERSSLRLVQKPGG